jgi:RND family efflux transporter MFP subunit
MLAAAWRLFAPKGACAVSFFIQFVKLILLAAVVLAAYAIYRPDMAAIYAPRLAPYALAAHAYLPAAVTGEPPAAASVAAPPRPPVSVVIAEVQRKTVPWTITEIGTAQAIASVALKSHFDATVEKVEVADGAEVKAGDVLFTLDDRQAQAQLAMAQAQIAKDEAQFSQAERDVTRYTDLVARSATPILNLDNAKTASATSRAAVIGDAAAIRNMQVALGWYTITAPISGRVGVVNIKAGNIVKAGDNSSAGVLATINQISPIYVALSVSQKFLPALREAMASGVKVSATPQGSTRAAQGKLALIDNTVDPATGTIVIRAEFANSDELLWPGQLCNLTLTLREEPNTVVVPREAIQISQDGNYVFAVKDGAAHVVPVVVGRTEGLDTVIEKGLNGGEKVVVDGALLLYEGAKIVPRGESKGAAG